MVTLLPLGRVAPAVGEVITELGLVVSADALAATSPD